MYKIKFNGISQEIAESIKVGFKDQFKFALLKMYWVNTMNSQK